MKMKHFVLGLIYNRNKSHVLLVKKKRPDWQAGRVNGIGGKIEVDETPLQAMNREASEETHYGFTFEHFLTFVCPGGTVYVFKAICPTAEITFEQVEDEVLFISPVKDLPLNLMSNVRWIIPISISNLQFPLMLQQNTLGIE